MTLARDTQKTRLSRFAVAQKVAHLTPAPCARVLEPFARYHPPPDPNENPGAIVGTAAGARRSLENVFKPSLSPICTLTQAAWWSLALANMGALLLVVIFGGGTR